MNCISFWSARPLSLPGKEFADDGCGLAIGLNALCLGGLSASTSSCRTIFYVPLLSAGFGFESTVREFRENVWWLLTSLREALQCFLPVENVLESVDCARYGVG